MPGYHSEGGNERYRGRGRGGYGWGGRDGGGGRGYSHRGGGGGGRYTDRNRWSEGGGGGGGGGRQQQGPPRGYRDSYSHHRYREGHASGGGGGGGGHSSHHHHPWHDGGRGGEGYGSSGKRLGGSTPDLLRSLTELGHISDKESRIALDILKTVLGSESSGGSHRDDWDMGPPARKIRRVDWDGGARSAHMHKYPQHRDRPYAARREHWGRGGGATVHRGPHCYRKMSDTLLREMEMARLEMPQPDGKEEAKVMEKKAAGGGVKRVRDGDKEKASAGEEGAASSDAKEPPAEEGSDEQPKDSKEQKEEKEEGKEGEEEEPAKKKEGEQADEARDANLVIPRSALKCHMCDMTKFPNVKAYLSHLGSKNHERIAHNFHARCAASMDLLIAESQLSCKRKSKNRGHNRWCFECDCFMNTHPKEHCQSTEHMLVSQYMELQCCGYVYNRANVEEHRLSMRHLKNQISVEEAQLEEEKEEKEKEAAEGEDADISFHKEVSQLKRLSAQETEEEVPPLTPDTLPPYDPEQPLGLEMLYKETVYRCTVCRCALSSARQAKYHFSSLEHYHSISQHLTAIEEAKELERKRLEEEEEAEEAKKIKELEEEAEGRENAGEEEEDIANMETVDVADEDGDGDGDSVGGEGEEEQVAEEDEEGEGEGEGEEEEEEEEEMEEETEDTRPADQEEEEDVAPKESPSGENQEEQEEEEEPMEEEVLGEEEEEEEVDDGTIEGLEDEADDYEDGLNSISDDGGEGGTDE